MSILYTYDTGWIISHEDYINNVYKSVMNAGNSCKFIVNPNLFKIDVPFTNSISKDRIKRSVSNGDSFKYLLNDIEEVQKLFKKFKEQETRLFFNTSLQSSKNSEASSTADEVYKKSGKILSANIFGENSRDDAIVIQYATEKFLFPPNCKFYCKNITEIDTVLKDTKYDLILLDPPWWNKYVRRKKSKSMEAAYKMIYTEDLNILPIEKILSDNGIVVIWCTNSYQHQNILLEDIFTKWNLKLYTKWFWIKVTRSGIPICKFSEPPGKQPFEQILIASKHSELKVPRSKLIVSVPSALHSHKPPLVEILQQYLPDQPRCLEIFARYLLPGWTSWGLEAIRFQHESLYVCI